MCCFESSACVQALQSLLAVHRFKMGADSVTFNQEYVDPDQQDAQQEALPTEEWRGGAYRMMDRCYLSPNAQNHADDSYSLIKWTWSLRQPPIREKNQALPLLSVLQQMPE